MLKHDKFQQFFGRFGKGRNRPEGKSGPDAPNSAGGGNSAGSPGNAENKDSTKGSDNADVPDFLKDLSNLEDGATIVTSYLSKTEIVLIGAGILLALAGLVLLFVKGPKKKGILKWKRNLIVVILMIAMCFGATSFMVKIGKVEPFFGNLAYAYRDYGVVYCFINTWLNTGISKPSGYNEKTIKKIFNEDELGEDGVMLLEDKDMDEEYPNILFLQLESFIDPSTVEYLKLSGDACPNFRALAEEYSSGELTVPACGAGTANVEFEVLTGLSVKFFGPGEYP